MLEERIVPHLVGSGDCVRSFVEIMERLHPFACVHGGNACGVEGARWRLSRCVHYHIVRGAWHPPKGDLLSA
jgi:hypothetical protein